MLKYDPHNISTTFSTLFRYFFNVTTFKPLSDNDVNIIPIMLIVVFGFFVLFSIPYRYKENHQTVRW